MQCRQNIWRRHKKFSLKVDRDGGQPVQSALVDAFSKLQWVNKFIMWGKHLELALSAVSFITDVFLWHDWLTARRENLFHLQDVTWRHTQLELAWVFVDIVGIPWFAEWVNQLRSYFLDGSMLSWTAHDLLISHALRELRYTLLTVVIHYSRRSILIKDWH